MQSKMCSNYNWHKMWLSMSLKSAYVYICLAHSCIWVIITSYSIVSIHVLCGYVLSGQVTKIVKNILVCMYVAIKIIVSHMCKPTIAQLTLWRLRKCLSFIVLCHPLVKLQWQLPQYNRPHMNLNCQYGGIL